MSGMEKQESIDELAKKLEELYRKKAATSASGTEARSAYKLAPITFLRSLSKASTSLTGSKKSIEDQIRFIEVILLQKINSEMEANGITQKMKKAYINGHKDFSVTTKNTLLIGLKEHFEYQPTIEDIEDEIKSQEKKTIKKFVQKCLDETLEKPLFLALDATIKNIEAADENINSYYTKSQQKEVQYLAVRLKASEVVLKSYLKSATKSNIANLYIENGVLHYSGESPTDKELGIHMDKLKEIYITFEELRNTLRELNRVYTTLLSGVRDVNTINYMKPTRDLMETFNKNIGLLLELKLFVDLMDKQMNPTGKVSKMDSFGAMPLDRFNLEPYGLTVEQMLERKDNRDANKLKH